MSRIFRPAPTSRLKPPKWPINPGLVDPAWRWVWEHPALKGAWAIWENGGTAAGAAVVRDYGPNRHDATLTKSAGWTGEPFDWQPTTRGIALAPDAAVQAGESFAILTNRRILTALPVTIVAFVRYSGTLGGAARRTIASQRSGASRDFEFRVNDSGQVLSWLGTNTAVNSSLALTAGEEYSLAAKVTTAGAVTFYRAHNGVLAVDEAGGAVTFADNQQFALGGIDSVGDNQWADRLGIVYAFSTKLLDWQIRALLIDPFGPFRPARRVLVSAPAGGITGDLSKSLPFVLLAAATVLLSGDLAKPLPLALASDGGVVVVGAVTRSVPFALSADGDVAIAGALSLPFPITLDADGTVPAPPVNGSLNRVLPIAVTGAGAVGVVGSLTAVLSLSLASGLDGTAVPRPWPLILFRRRRR